MITDKEKSEIKEMLDLALKLEKVSNSMTDSGFCDQGDIQFLDDGGKRLSKLKEKYTIIE
jgi:hypothetical protein